MRVLRKKALRIANLVLDPGAQSPAVRSGLVSQ
jgi:hypothetical protein